MPHELRSPPPDARDRPPGALSTASSGQRYWIIGPAPAAGLNRRAFLHCRKLQLISFPEGLFEVNRNEPKNRLRALAGANAPTTGEATDGQQGTRLPTNSGARPLLGLA